MYGTLKKRKNQLVMILLSYAVTAEGGDCVGMTEIRIRIPLNCIGNNIKMDNRKKVCEVVAWIRLTVVRNRWKTRVNRIMNFQVP